MTDKKKMSPFARDLMDGLRDAPRPRQGKADSTPETVEHVVLVPDVKRSANR